MIIGINGKIGSGKDTVGKIIQFITYNKHRELKGFDTMSFSDFCIDYNLHNRSNWKIKKFADKLKDIVCLLIGCTREQLEDHEFKEKELGEEWAIPLKEEFVDIKNYEGLYQISNYGNVKSLSRSINNGKYTRASIDIISSTQYNTGGYKIITLWKDNKKQTLTIHKLVAGAFLIKETITDGVINHIDNNKDNNKVTNLEIVSQLYNSNCHKTTNGVRQNISGNYTARITINKNRITLGTYNTEEEAIMVRNNKLKELDTFIPIKYIPKRYTPRLLMQLIGTDLFRNKIHYNTWINSLFSEYKQEENYQVGTTPENLKWIDGEFPDWIITDMRFPNELNSVKDRKGITIRVNNPYIRYSDGSYRAKSKMMGDFDNKHPSETALNNATFDYELDNNGTIEELIEKVKEILFKENII